MSTTDRTITPLRRPVTQKELDRAVASVTPLNTLRQLIAAEAGEATWTLAWLGDLHIQAPQVYPKLSRLYVEDVDTTANLRLALTEVAALDPPADLIVYGGDLADSGCGGMAPTDEYSQVRQCLDAWQPAGIRAIAIAGNHDHANAPLTPQWHEAWQLRSTPAWPTSALAEDYCYVTRHRGWRVIALDSRQGGPLGEPQRQWLAHELAADREVPTIVLVHRPFLCVGNWVDDCRLIDRATFNLIDACPAVKVILSGHTHRTAAWRYRGKLHVVFPAVAYGIPDPVGWGALVMGKRDVRAVLVKDMATNWYDTVPMRLRRAAGKCRQLKPTPFASDMRFNPCMLPREEAAS